MRRRERLAAWAWDNIPGGVPMQLWIWNACPALGRWLDRQAERRDLIGRTKR